MPELSAEVLREFEKQLHTNPELISRLADHALYRVRARYWRGVWNGHLPGGREPEDLASEAIANVLSGKRQWDPDKNPDVLPYLCSVVDSKVHHLVHSQENRRDRLFSPSADPDADPISNLEDMTVNPPDEDRQAKEMEELNNKLLEALMDFVGDDPLLQDIIICTMDGLDNRAAIATQLGRTAQEITNAQNQYRHQPSRLAKEICLNKTKGPQLRTR
jgi:DNA-directed RNA polymerase specialized sigma24 family protein